MVGWGGTGTGAEGVTGEDSKFRKAENTVLEVTDTLLIWVFNPPESNLAQPLEGISGPGDSGGPAFIETEAGMTLAGISSGQDGMGFGPGKYGVRELYARVSAAVDWINKIIKK